MKVQLWIFVLIETLWNVKEYLRRITEGSEQY